MFEFCWFRSQITAEQPLVVAADAPLSSSQLQLTTTGSEAEVLTKCLLVFVNCRCLYLLWTMSSCCILPDLFTNYLHMFLNFQVKENKNHVTSDRNSNEVKTWVWFVVWDQNLKNAVFKLSWCPTVQFKNWL